MHSVTWLTGVLFVISTSLGAQGVFERISLEHGLSQSSVFAIVQDHQGFMWFGTQDGLNRYDGRRFEIFRRRGDDSTSLSHNFVRRLFVDRDGKLWVGTANYGVNCYDPVTGRFKRFLTNPADTNSISNNVIWAIEQTRDGVLWFGTDDGLNSYDTRTDTWDRYYFREGTKNAASLNSIHALYEDSTGALWVGHQEGISRFDPHTKTFQRLHRSFVINRFLDDNAGSFWAVGSGILSYDRREMRFVPAKSRLATGGLLPGGNEAGLVSRNRDIWFGSHDGLLHRKAGEHTFRNYRHNPDDPQSLSENSVLSMWEDRSGILWVGTYQGVNKHVPTRMKFTTYTYNPNDDNSLSSLRVRGFSEDPRGTIWIATQYGLNRFDPRTERFRRYYASGKERTMRDNHVWCVIAEQTLPVTVWIGMNAGGVDCLEFPEPLSSESPVLRSYYPQEHPQALSGGTVLSAFQDKTGDLWFGLLNAGVCWYRKESRTFIRIQPIPGNTNSLAGLNIWAIREDGNGHLWFGSQGDGVTRLDRKSWTFTRYQHQDLIPTTISDNNVTSIHEDSDGTLWFGTYTGLNRFEPRSETFQRFTSEHGLANDVIYAIEEDGNNNLWLSSNRGLSRFNRKTYKVVNYDVQDGLQSNEFNQGASLRASTGEMYFGGINGFSRFHPDSIRDNPHKPYVVLVDFRVFNDPIHPAKEKRRLLSTIETAQELHLSYRDAVLTFEFAALEYTNPVNNRYAYMMEGFDNEWNYVGKKREATYTNLDPGTYIFRVKASNNDNVWNEEGISLKVFIAPPWWMTWWFRGILIVTFLSVGPIIYFRRVTQLKRDHALQQDVSRRLIESQEAERKRIASELHDSVGQDLLVIKNRAYLAQKNKRLNTKVREQLDHITNTVTQSLQNVRQIARNLRPYHLDRVGLTGAIRSTLEDIAESSDIRFDMNIENVDNLFPHQEKEIEVNVFRIVQEGVNNVLKHSHANEVKIDIRSIERKLSIVIEDDGKGFDPSSVTLKAGLGLSGISERVRILGGTYSIESTPGKGTTVMVSIPVEKREKKT